MSSQRPVPESKHKPVPRTYIRKILIPPQLFQPSAEQTPYDTSSASAAASAGDTQPTLRQRNTLRDLPNPKRLKQEDSEKLNQSQMRADRRDRDFPAISALTLRFYMTGNPAKRDNDLMTKQQTKKKEDFQVVRVVANSENIPMAVEYEREQIIEGQKKKVWIILTLEIWEYEKKERFYFTTRTESVSDVTRQKTWDEVVRTIKAQQDPLKNELLTKVIEERSDRSWKIVYPIYVENDNAEPTEEDSRVKIQIIEEPEAAERFIFEKIVQEKSCIYLPIRKIPGSEEKNSKNFDKYKINKK